jgi:ABC-type multidrug transport system ATPase subunit
MRISLTDAGKRYNREWIFRNLSFVFEPGGRYAITGPNGSGKSTLLQVIAGALAPSEGTIAYQHGDVSIENEAFFRSISLCAPYLELIEEMTALEFLRFHQSFKPFQRGLDPEYILAELGLSSAAGKQIRFFSSGMRQRIKLAQAIFADAPVLLLDEPCTNLDQAGIEQYHALVEAYATHKLIIVSSNDPQEYIYCPEVLKISDWK